jgi:hypothetical protein
MYVNAHTFRNQHTAPAARLRGIARVHVHDFGTSFFRFVSQQLFEIALPSIVCAQGNVMIAGHKGARRIFQLDQTIVINQTTCEHMLKIAVLVGNLAGQHLPRVLHTPK